MTPQQWLNVNFNQLLYLRFKEFLIEISTYILGLSTVPILWCWRRYQSLIVVSHDMQTLAYDACLPHLPIMLYMCIHVDSFYMLLKSSPNTVGPSTPHTICCKCNRLLHTLLFWHFLSG